MIYENYDIAVCETPADSDDIEDEFGNTSSLVQWEESDGAFKAIGKTRKSLPPGLYSIQITNSGLYFVSQNTSTNNLIRFSDSSTDEIMREIDIFWKSKQKYKKFDVQYKRGILMHGLPGSGKSSVIKLLIRDVISRGGIAIDFENSTTFSYGMSVLRKVHPSKPVVCIMEDMESIMENESPSSVLNTLDGSTSSWDNIIFIATSNYPEKLEERIKDRPSRFDRVIEVGLPSAKMRTTYLKFLFKNAKLNIKPIKKWVKDTDGLTFPHLQEIFLAVNLYDIDYDIALGRVKGMAQPISSDKHKRNTLSSGFGSMVESIVDEDDYS